MATSLTIAEKTYWQERITAHFDRQLEILRSAKPDFVAQIESAAQQGALESLGVAELQAELEDLEHQKSKLYDRQSELQVEIVVKILGIPRSKVERHTYQFTESKERAIAHQKAVWRDKMLRETSHGRAICDLERERDTLLDTVRLATSHVQIQEACSKVKNLLSDRS